MVIQSIQAKFSSLLKRKKYHGLIITLSLLYYNISSCWFQVNFCHVLLCLPFLPSFTYIFVLYSVPSWKEYGDFYYSKLKYEWRLCMQSCWITPKTQETEEWEQSVSLLVVRRFFYHLPLRKETVTAMTSGSVSCCIPEGFFFSYNICLLEIQFSFAFVKQLHWLRLYF